MSGGFLLCILRADVFGTNDRIMVDAGHRYRTARYCNDLSRLNCSWEVLPTAPTSDRSLFNIEKFGAFLIAKLFDEIG